MPRSTRSRLGGSTTGAENRSSLPPQALDPLTQALMPSSSKMLMSSSPRKRAGPGPRTPGRRRVVGGVPSSSVLTPNLSKANRLLTASTRPSDGGATSKFLSPTKVLEDAPYTPSRKAGGEETVFETPRAGLTGKKAVTPFARRLAGSVDGDGDNEVEEQEDEEDEILVPDSLTSSPMKLPPPLPTLALEAAGLLAQSTPLAKKKQEKGKGKKRNSDAAFEEEALEAEVEEEETRRKRRGNAKKVKATTWHWELDDDLPSTPPSGQFSAKKTLLDVDDDSPIDFNYPSSTPEEEEVEIVPETQPTLQDEEEAVEDSTEEIEEEDDNEGSDLEEEEGDEEPKPKTIRGKKKQLSTAALQSLLPKRRTTRLRPSQQKKKALAHQKKRQQQPKRPTRKVLGDVTSSIVEDELLDDLDNPDALLENDEDNLNNVQESFNGTIYRDDSVLTSSPTSQADEMTPYPKGRRAATRRKTTTTTIAKAKSKAKPAIVNKAKGKGKAKAPPKTPVITPSAAKITYSSKRRQSTSSDKENMSPGRRTPLAVEDDSDADEENVRPGTSAAAIAPPQTPKEDLKRIAQKFKEVDQWDLDFEDVSVDTSSDGVVKGGR